MHTLPVPAGGQAMVFAEAPAEHTLYIDGSAKRGSLGGGAYLVTPEGEFTEFWRFDTQSRDSNQAEILALRHALDWVAKVAPERPLQVFTDSFEMLIHLTKRTERYLGLNELPALFSARQVVRLQNIPNHCNRRADALARKALGMR